MDFIKYLSVRVKELRRSKNISQQVLADALKINKASVSRIESENQSVTVDTLIAIAEYFDVSIDYLVGRIDEGCRPMTENDDELELVSIFRSVDDFSKGFMLENARIIKEKHPLRMDKTK